MTSVQLRAGPASRDPAGARSPQRKGMPRLAPLDGLRALAVIAVMCFHAGVSWMPGGFLGVDLFFVLSGFLISGLLVSEWQRRSAISLRRFYARRALRLLPAVVLLCAVLLIVGPVLSGVDARNELWKGIAGTVFYFANWQQAFSLIAPFQLTDHTWSLAIEEQFYLFWPPLLFLTLSWARRRGRDAVSAAIVVALVLAVASALLRIALWDGPSYASWSRLYYGTDTRIDSLLIGGALGIAFATGRMAWARRWMPAAAPFALLGVLLTFRFAHRDSPVIYLGGLTVLAVAVAILIGGVALAPTGTLGRAFAWAPFVAIGRISYGIYLWHWPIFRWLHPEALGLSWGPTQLVRVGVTLAIATLSYFVVERPLLRLRHRFDPPVATASARSAERR